MNPAVNRVLAAALAPFLGMWLESRGYKLSEDQLMALVAAVPVVYHFLAAFGQKCVDAFVLYFPPPSKPAEPAKV